MQNENLSNELFTTTQNIIKNIQQQALVQADISHIIDLLHANNVDYNHWAGQLLHLENFHLNPYNKITRDAIRQIIQRYYDDRVYFSRYE